jgi:hypothetical protein
MAHPTPRISAKFIGTIAVVGCLSAGALVAAATASASAGGDNNKGDVWVDNVGQPAGPGHEQDPHLACANINLWGDKLADGSGKYTIDGWAPSGSKEQVYAHAWTYNRSTGGTQVLNVINVIKLVKAAQAAGDTPVNQQGLHFKLQFVQDPRKHKTFWVNCAASTPTPTPTPKPTPTPTHYPSAS